MRVIEDKFKHEGVNFEVIKRGEKAIMLRASAYFIPCSCVEVWQLRTSKASYISGVKIEAGEVNPGNNNYPYNAQQFISDHYPGGHEEMMQIENKRFDEYESGILPKPLHDAE